MAVFGVYRAESVTKLDLTLRLLILLTAASGLAVGAVWLGRWLATKDQPPTAAGLNTAAASQPPNYSKLSAVPTSTGTSQPALASTDRFSVGIRSGMFDMTDGPINLYMVGYNSIYGRAVSPVTCLLHLHIVNNQSVPVTIEGYSVAEGASVTGPWSDLLPISLDTSELYILGARSPSPHTVLFPKGAYGLGTPMTMEDMKHAALVMPRPKFESQLGHAVEPNKTIGGWAAFEARDRNHPPGGNYFRITLRDSRHNVFSGVCTLPTKEAGDAEHDTQPGAIDVVGQVVDLSLFRVRYYNDPYPPNAK